MGYAFVVRRNVRSQGSKSNCLGSSAYADTHGSIGFQLVAAIRDASSCCGVKTLLSCFKCSSASVSPRAAASLYASQVKDLLFVVNGVDAVDAASENYGVGYGYAYGYGYGSGKGYGYGHDGRSKTDSKRLTSIQDRTAALEDEANDEDEEEAIA